MAKSYKKCAINQNVTTKFDGKQKRREANIKIKRNVITNYNTNANSGQMNKTNANEYERILQRIKWNIRVLVFKFAIKMHLHLENRKTKNEKLNNASVEKAPKRKRCKGCSRGKGRKQTTKKTNTTKAIQH